MRNEYDFTDGIKNPYSKQLKKQITIRIDEDTIDYFKNEADKTGLSYQNLMMLAKCTPSYFRDDKSSENKVGGIKKTEKGKQKILAQGSGEDLMKSVFARRGLAFNTD